MIITQHAHIYSFHTSKFNFGEIFFKIFLSIQPLILVFSASKVTTCSSVNRTCQVVVNSKLRQQGDNMLIKYQSYHAIVKQDGSHYMINLAPVSFEFENMTVTLMDITKCS